MQTDHVKATLIGLWILTVGVLGYVVGSTSFVGWTVLAVIALTPPVVLMRLWSAPAPSMSETIRDVLR
jgi:multisubunit Na+/H+ antiporter MnhG subunit